LSEWEKWFSIGSVEGKTQAIITNALRFVRLTLEQVAAVQPQSNVSKIDGFDKTIIDDIQAKISSILTAAGSATDDEANILRKELSKIIHSIEKYSSLVSSEPANNDIKLSLDKDLIVAKGLIKRFGDTLTNSSPIFNLFGRKLFTVFVMECGVEYTLKFATPFISAKSDRSNFTTEEQDALNEASSFLGGAFADFNDQNYRDSYVYKSLLVEPQEDPDTRKFLDSLLPKIGATKQIVILSVKEAVEILDPAYVASSTMRLDVINLEVMLKKELID
jgi:hypothetical protein